MKKKIVHLLYFVVLSIAFLANKTTCAQNLVKNPSFEQYDTCPDINDSKLLYWESYSTSSYMNSCASNFNSGVPKNRHGFQAAKDGLGYMVGIANDLNTNRITYNSGQFTQPLQEDSLYCISYYICAPEGLTNSINNIDAYLSKRPPTRWDQDENNALSQYEPQIYSRKYIIDSINWTKVSQIYKAQGGENYITIGNFYNSSRTNLRSPIIYYLLDLVSVLPLHLEGPFGKDITLCSSQFPYTLKAPKGYDSYSWGADTLVIMEVGVYGIACFLDDCGRIDAELDVGLKFSPNLSLREDTTICKGEPFLIEAQSGFNSYSWNTGESSSQVLVTRSGTYIAEATDQCGVQIDSIQVTIDSVPDINLSIGEDTNICENENTNLPIILEANHLLPNYFWSNGESSSSITVQTGGNYWLTAKYGCGDLKSNEIRVEACIPKKDIIFIPNAFSPNNDGLNDVFEPEINGAQLLEMSIFNRWGEQIYFSVKQFRWDGLCGLTACQMGLYVFVIRYEDESGNIFQRNGKFQLVM